MAIPDKLCLRQNQLYDKIIGEFKFEIISILAPRAFYYRKTCLLEEDYYVWSLEMVDY